MKVIDNETGRCWNNNKAYWVYFDGKYWIITNSDYWGIAYYDRVEAAEAALNKFYSDGIISNEGRILTQQSEIKYQEGRHAAKVNARKGLIAIFACFFGLAIFSIATLYLFSEYQLIGQNELAQKIKYLATIAPLLGISLIGFGFYLCTRASH